MRKKAKLQAARAQDHIRTYPTSVSHGGNSPKQSYDKRVQAEFQCSYCGEWNQTDVDESAGGAQSYVEDCQICCQANVLTVQFDKRDCRFVIQAQRES